MPRRLAIAFASLLVLIVAPDAVAAIEGPCTATIAGQDVASWQTGPLDDALTVDRDSLVSVTMSSGRPLVRLKVELEFAGVRWTVHDRPATGTTWASEVPVSDYGVYGMGLWKVVASSEGRGFACAGTALISVEDDHPLDPLATISGLAGLGLALMGALGVLAIASRIGKSRAAPFSGVLLGAMMGVGVCVLLQQFSIVYPTIGVAGALIAIGAAVGLAFSLFGLPGRGSDAQA